MLQLGGTLLQLVSSSLSALLSLVTDVLACLLSLFQHPLLTDPTASHAGTRSALEATCGAGGSGGGGRGRLLTHSERILHALLHSVCGLLDAVHG